MDSSSSFLAKPLITIFFIFSATFSPCLCSSEEEEVVYFTECSHGYDCGSLINITYPFWGNSRPRSCGRQGFEIDCQNNQSPVIKINGKEFDVMNIDKTSNTMRIGRSDLSGKLCMIQNDVVPITLNYSLFDYAPDVQNLTLIYGCQQPPSKELLPSQTNFACTFSNGTNQTVYYDTQGEFPSRHPNKAALGSCKPVQVPVSRSFLDQNTEGIGEDQVEEAVKQGFHVDYSHQTILLCKECEKSGGRCGSNVTNDAFLCYCRDKHYNVMCPAPGDETNWKTKIIIGVVAAFLGVVIMCLIFYIYLRHTRKRNVPSYVKSRDISSEAFSSVKDVEKGSTYLGVHIFDYDELLKATDNFDSSKELGDGGFGTVYFGKLLDGRSIAVKRLYENNFRRVEQFMNEVGILARLHHQNLVSLYGCTSRHSRELLLVYEYIPNGTVADHLHGEKAKPGGMPWSTRVNIAIETASALTYLHASDIIHRDVKTNNILLDNNFCVKVADFGLSRLFPVDVTHVSTAPQGTPGYVDPDYHQCYQLTSKSDVFSFGVVLMELVSSLPAVDITRHRHEINLSTMAINRIQNHALHELVDPCLGFESDFTIRKMITAVAELAFQCLQGEKEMRPSMPDIVEELKRIQSKDYKAEEAEDKNTSADEAVLLKSGPLTLSPDSVNSNWLSWSTTPTKSG